MSYLHKLNWKEAERARKKLESSHSDKVGIFVIFMIFIVGLLIGRFLF